MRMVLDNGLLNFPMVYSPYSEKMDEEKENFWKEMFHFGSFTPQNEMAVLAYDMNGHL